MKNVTTSPVDYAIPTRYSLLSRLQDREDHASWKDFFDTYWRLIYALAIKSGLREIEAQDVVQETVICVAKDIDKFKRDRSLGSFKGWLRTIIHWRIVDQFRKRGIRPLKDDGLQTVNDPPPDLHEIPDPAGPELEALWQEEWRSNLFQAALDRVKRRVREEHFQIFALYVIKGWPVLKVARAMHVSPGKVYLVKHRLAVQVRKEIQRLEETPF